MAREASTVNYHYLLYVLEKVKLASSREHGVFHTWSDSEEHEACVQLEKDGLIRRYHEEKVDGFPEHFAWRYEG